MADINEASTSKAPTHVACHVREGKTNDDIGFWTRIGTVCAHKDGKGFNIQIETVPLDSRIALRVASDSK